MAVSKELKAMNLGISKGWVCERGRREEGEGGNLCNYYLKNDYRKDNLALLGV